MEHVQLQIELKNALEQTHNATDLCSLERGDGAGGDPIIYLVVHPGRDQMR